MIKSVIRKCDTRIYDRSFDSLNVCYPEEFWRSGRGNISRERQWNITGVKREKRMGWGGCGRTGRKESVGRNN